MPRVTKEPAERRQEILDTAMKLFYEKGYEKTSITDIAKEMGVAQGLCYRYFSSKELIFDTALDQYAEILVEQMTKGILKHEYDLKQIILKMPTFIDVEKNDSFYYKVCHGKESKKTHQQLSMKVCEKMTSIVQRMLDKAIKKGEIKQLDTKTVASFCVYGQLGILQDDELKAEEKIKKIKEFLLKIFNFDS